MEIQYFDEIPSIYSKGNIVLYSLIVCFISITFYSDESAFILIPGYIIGGIYVLRTKSFLDENVVLDIQNGETLGLPSLDNFLGNLSIIFGVLIALCGGVFLVFGFQDANPFLLGVSVVNLYWSINLIKYSMCTLSLLKKKEVNLD
jgi:hypothetical protein